LEPKLFSDEKLCAHQIQKVINYAQHNIVSPALYYLCCFSTQADAKANKYPSATMYIFTEFYTQKISMLYRMYKLENRILSPKKFGG